MTPRSTVQGFKGPPQHAVTEHEMGWIMFIRLLTNDSDPSPTLRAIKVLRQVLSTEDAPKMNDG